MFVGGGGWQEEEKFCHFHVRFPTFDFYCIYSMSLASAWKRRAWLGLFTVGEYFSRLEYP